MLRSVLAGICLTVIVALSLGGGIAVMTVSLATEVQAQSQGNVPGHVRGNVGQAEMWRGIRHGLEGTVSIPDKKAGVLVQSDGDQWRAKRNGPVSTYGGWALLVFIVGIVVFYLLRGRIRIDSGLSGRLILRFKNLEVFGHWLTASSFVVLGLTGLNILYGKHILMPVIGQAAFAEILSLGKFAHNYIAFAFMLGLILMFVQWAKDNLWDRYDANWLLRAGGLWHKSDHPPANKFNMGQKIIFWATIIGGAFLSVSGVNLMFPFEFGNLQDMQDWQIIHSIASLVLLCFIIGHIYIGSLGMEGAYSAISTGYVDENWAKEHHSEWVKKLNEIDAEADAGDEGERPMPAE